MDEELPKINETELVGLLGVSQRKVRLVAKALMNAHRTNQQCIMRFCMAFIEEMAAQSFDLRNQASVEVARKVVAATTERDRIMPYI